MFWVSEYLGNLRYLAVYEWQTNNLFTKRCIEFVIVAMEVTLKDQVERSILKHLITQIKVSLIFC